MACMHIYTAQCQSCAPFPTITGLHYHTTAALCIIQPCWLMMNMMTLKTHSYCIGLTKSCITYYTIEYNKKNKCNRNTLWGKETYQNLPLLNDAAYQCPSMLIMKEIKAQSTRWEVIRKKQEEWLSGLSTSYYPYLRLLHVHTARVL